jgi:hypothetical protein
MEHQKCIEGLACHGKDFEAIASTMVHSCMTLLIMPSPSFSLFLFAGLSTPVKVKTRTATQVYNHVRRYFKVESKGYLMFLKSKFPEVPTPLRLCADCGVVTASCGEDNAHGVWSGLKWCAKCNREGGHGAIMYRNRPPSSRPHPCPVLANASHVFQRHKEARKQW